LARVLDASARHAMVMVVGLPFRFGGALYNVAAVMCRGKLLGLVPKQHIPNYSEFYEARHFTSGKGLKPMTVTICGQETLFGDGLLFRCADMPDFVLGCEICEDLWVSTPPSTFLCEAGATVIANPSASDETIGKASYRRELVRSHSARLLCGYIYADAGMGESTQDLIFSGHDLIAENGGLLAESKRFSTGIVYSELDLARLMHERRRMNTFEARPGACTEVVFDLPVRDTALTRPFAQTPFVPADRGDLEARCEEILSMQATGLATRMQHARCKTAVIGLSGGLDSTLALVVIVHAFDMLGIDRKGIHAVTMPCFGTTSRTKSNAMRLAEAYGATLHTIDIKASVNQHFEDIGHSWDDHTVTFENSQARTRTLVLMDLANKLGGLVIGTGDLSELALGWATYNGDHMSMYGVNGSIPKTLVRYLTAYEAAHSPEDLKNILLDVLNTPVSPELLPPKDGEISQKTEELVGPYELHDFYLYYMVRFGYSPRKIFRIARIAFDGVYDDETIKKWLVTFVRRFFIQQFKRSCLPDGPKVGSVTLSPRGDWRMPSDAVSELWLSEAESL
ncbi:MAG: NAD(+) synthase, partial [Butyricicoccus sp.]|nr:NAD(+) synthase [Butyricicoccus sp.]